MSSSQAKLDVVPTRMTLMALKNRYKAASRGHDLLKKKADALMIRFRRILTNIQEKKENMATYIREATVSLTAAKFLAGDNLNHMVIESVDVASYKIRMGTENIVGVHLPVFEPYVTSVQGMFTVDIMDKKTYTRCITVKEYTGLAQGGQKVKVCRENYFKALEALVELASLQTTFITLDQIIKITNRRVNAIEHVVKPRLKNTINYVDLELEELEREETFRLKKIRSNMEQEKQELEKELEKSGVEKTKKTSVLEMEDEDDEDIIF